MGKEYEILLQKSFSFFLQKNIWMRKGCGVLLEMLCHIVLFLETLVIRQQLKIWFLMVVVIFLELVIIRATPKEKLYACIVESSYLIGKENPKGVVSCVLK